MFGLLDAGVIGNSIGVGSGMVGTRYDCDPPRPVKGPCKGDEAAPEPIRAELSRYLRRIAYEMSSISSESQDQVRVAKVEAWRHDGRSADEWTVLAQYDVRRSGYRDTRGCRGEACEGGSWDYTQTQCATFHFKRVGDGWRLDPPRCAPGIGRGTFKPRVVKESR